MLTFDIEGLANWERQLTLFPERARQAMAIAINQTAKRDAAVSIRKEMMQQVAFKRNYLVRHTPVRANASSRKLSAKITARDRPTMLARFATDRRIPKRQTGVRVKVKPSRSVFMKKAWLHDFGDNGSNLAVMVRTKNGQPPKGVLHGGARYVSGMDAWILYAPSIDQLMGDVVEDKRELISKSVEREFLRQFNRLKGL